MKLALAAFLFAVSAYANPTLPPLFGNHMVLQQGGAVPVWGWADPQERITVSILDQVRQTTADAAGRWRITLAALPAGGPYRLTVQGNRAVVIDDVLVGEVWICSGQSNMAFALSGAATASEDIPDADYTGIRLFQVPSRSVLQPLETTAGAVWRPLTPDSARGFSAVGYLFAREHLVWDASGGLDLCRGPGGQPGIAAASEILGRRQSRRPRTRRPPRRIPTRLRPLRTSALRRRHGTASSRLELQLGRRAQLALRDDPLRRERLGVRCARERRH